MLTENKSNIHFRLDFKIDQYPEEIVICHEYDPIKNIWNKNEITIKIESTPFGNGSMRECFRLYVYPIIDLANESKINASYLGKNFQHLHRIEIGIVHVITLQSDISLTCRMHTISMM